jgi:hypothetical protein
MDIIMHKEIATKCTAQSLHGVWSVREVLLFIIVMAVFFVFFPVQDDGIRKSPRVRRVGMLLLF